MAIVYDRMALYDSLVGTFTVWGIFLSILLVRSLRLDVALILGMTAGAGVLNKSNAFFTIYLLPLSVLLFDFKAKKKMKRFLLWVGLSLVAIILTYGYYSILRLSPFFHIIDEKNTTFIYPFSEWIKHPFTFFFGNLKGLASWFVGYFSAPLVFMAAAAFFIKSEKFREKLYLLTWFAIPLLLLALFGKVLYPRYIFFMTLPLLPLVAYALYTLRQKMANTMLYIGILFLIFLPSIRSEYLVLTNFGSAPIPQPDIDQYYAEWPAGGGVNEAVAFFSEKAKSEKIYIGTQGTFGLLPHALEIYLGKNPNIEIEGIWPIEAKPPEKLLLKASEKTVYLVFYQPCVPCSAAGIVPATWPVREELKLRKAHKNTYFTIYKLQSK